VIIFFFTSSNSIVFDLFVVVFAFLVTSKEGNPGTMQVTTTDVENIF
jgi:hypothetical protein